MPHEVRVDRPGHRMGMRRSERSSRQGRGRHMAVRGASGETDPANWGGLMPDPHSSSRCSGTRMRRWAALVVPTAVVLTGSFGASAYAATGGNAAAHTASSSSTGADANHGVGNGVGNGNDKHS